MPKQPKIKVPAVIHMSDEKRSQPFDAAPWLDQIDAATLKVLLRDTDEDGYDGSWPCLATNECSCWTAQHDLDVQIILDYCDANDRIYYWTWIDGRAALHYLADARLDLLRQLAA